MVCKLIDKLKDIFKDIDSLEASLNQLQTTLREIQIEFNNLQGNFEDLQETINQEIARLEKDIEDIKNGKYIDSLLPAIEQFINNNIKSYVANIVKYVVFGLNNDGYFVAYIPESWQFMKFETIQDPASPLYGHLTMTW